MDLEDPPSAAELQSEINTIKENQALAHDNALNNINQDTNTSINSKKKGKGKGRARLEYWLEVEESDSEPNADGIFLCLYYYSGF